jgi:hypothetical protein
MLHAAIRFIGAARRDDRRRCRLVVDGQTDASQTSLEQLPPAADESTSGAVVPTSRCASHAQQGNLPMDGHSALVAFIPRSHRTYWIIAGVGCAVIAVLVLLYASWAVWDLHEQAGFHPTDGRIEALDLDGEGSLSVWYSSALLFLAAQVALLVGWMRSQNPEDYAGRYRVWYWAAGCWLLLSLDETASLHEAFKEFASKAAGTRVFGDGSIWWAGPYFGLLGFVGVKLFWEMRGCWLSSTLLQATGWVWALAVATQLGLILPESGARGVIVEESAEMLGDLLLLLSMMVHARYLIGGGEETGEAALEQKSARVDVPGGSGAVPSAHGKQKAFSKKK